TSCSAAMRWNSQPGRRPWQSRRSHGSSELPPTPGRRPNGQLLRATVPRSLRSRLSPRRPAHRRGPRQRQSAGSIALEQVPGRSCFTLLTSLIDKYNLFIHIGHVTGRRVLGQGPLPPVRLPPCPRTRFSRPPIGLVCAVPSRPASRPVALLPSPLRSVLGSFLPRRSVPWRAGRPRPGRPRLEPPSGRRFPAASLRSTRPGPHY